MREILSRRVEPHHSTTLRGGRLQLGILASAYVLIGVGAYASILQTFFVSDDFPFLDAVRSTPSFGVIFSPLAGRYFRPGVVLIYFLNYRISELSPLPYHLSMVLIHVANAWLVFVLGRTLAPARDLFVPALAGVLFLVFGGHAEAVSWVAGAADPLVTLFVLLALLFFLWSLDSARPAALLLGSWLAFAAALLSKESAVIFPGLVVICAALSRPSGIDRAIVRRTAIGLSVPILLIAAYFGLRRVVLGFPFVTLEGLGTSTNLLATTRAFVLRSFFPHGEVLSAIWYKYLDVLVLFPLAILLGRLVRRSEYRPLVLLGLCLGLALAPVLSLTIGIATPESERLIYMASAFASLLAVWFIDAAIKKRWAVTVIILTCTVGHTAALNRVNRNWQEAGALARATLSTLPQTMREHAHVGTPIYVLNLPDDVRGAYVFRRGFHEALRLAAPDQLATIAQTHVLSVHTISDMYRPVRVERRGLRTVRIDLGSGRLLGARPPPTSTFSISEWSPRSFVIDFSEAADGSLVVYFTPQQTAIVGRLPFSNEQKAVM